MPKQGQTTKQARRAERQEDHRAQLAEQDHIQHAVDNIIKIEGLSVATKGDDEEVDYKDLQLNQFKLNQLKTAVDLRLKLVNKYLPDLKNTEITAEGGGAIQITEVTRTIIPSG